MKNELVQYTFLFLLNLCIDKSCEERVDDCFYEVYKMQICDHSDSNVDKCLYRYCRESVDEVKE